MYKMNTQKKYPHVFTRLGPHMTNMYFTCVKHMLIHIILCLICVLFLFVTHVKYKCVLNMCKYIRKAHFHK